MYRDFEQEYQELDEKMRKVEALREDAYDCIHKCKNILAMMQFHFRGSSSDNLLSGLAGEFQQTQRASNRYFDEQEEFHRKEWARLTQEEQQFGGEESS